jgi:LPXTG-motif cell wall-anchored protein
MLMDILAGLVCGLFMGTVFLGALILIFLSNRDIYDRLAKRLPQGIPPALIMLSLLIALPPAWGVFGAIAGLIYNLALDLSPSAGLGSSDSIFTLAILCLTVLLMLPALFFIIKRKKLGWLLFVINLVFAGIFGWLLPLLAHWR